MLVQKDDIIIYELCVWLKKYLYVSRGHFQEQMKYGEKVKE